MDFNRTLFQLFIDFKKPMIQLIPVVNLHRQIFDTFHVQGVLKPEALFFPLVFIFALEYYIRRIKNLGGS
jgi:hypothetical protein